MMSLRTRYIGLTCLALSLIFLSTRFYDSDLNFTPPQTVLDVLNANEPPPPPIYKPAPIGSPVIIVDNFPLAAAAHSAADLPPLPSWNLPPHPHVEEKTPLFIGFTRNWRLIQQVVVSYITSGWPAEDIYVVENTGVMDSNALGYLSLQNPFFLNHTRLQMLGVNILVTPTLLTFAQLQNFYISTATSKAWPHYFWSHMDLVSLSIESAARFPHTDPSTPPPEEHEPWENRNLYENCVSSLREVTSPDPITGKVLQWANIFFSYDRLALVNVASYKSVGAWDTMIPFYLGDCDMHARLEMAGYAILDRKAGLVYDVASSLDDLAVLYRQVSGPKGEITEASWLDPSIAEDLQVEAEEAERVAAKKEKGGGKQKAVDPETAKKRKEAELKAKDAEAQRKAWALAALFVPQPSPTSLPVSSAAQPPRTLWTEDLPASKSYTNLLDILDRMQGSKATSSRGRNTWQARQSGGEGEPFYRDSAGFERGILMTIEHGRAMYREKWGHRDCDIVKVGYRADDAWKVEHDWVD